MSWEGERVGEGKEREARGQHSIRRMREFDVLENRSHEKLRDYAREKERESKREVEQRVKGNTMPLAFVSCLTFAPCL